MATSRAQTRARYRKYMASKTWAARRAEYWQTHKRVCRSCGSTTNIELHHVSYARMGKELDRDLMPLCELCHYGVHFLHQRTPHRFGLWAATYAFLRDPTVTPEQICEQRQVAGAAKVAAKAEQVAARRSRS